MVFFRALQEIAIAKFARGQCEKNCPRQLCSDAVMCEVYLVERIFICPMVEVRRTALDSYGALKKMSYDSTFKPNSFACAGNFATMYAFSSFSVGSYFGCSKQSLSLEPTSQQPR